ncbi:hypothetical protein [Falsigemmobacter faecalis]|uniref:Uncharacterized protein n=1 Tax=Falsigemmobacter faecalis TaxID=2488730 RepID=A0A3P3D1N4_9RHOB|nr:hypothetical protein [Falsigemmobacter faecalis]RRH68323.1 hypothetical protein EG244_19560 [Falsigemmobacter faecalis]
MISATDTALLDHISQQQDRACHLLGLLKGMAALDMSRASPDAVTSMIHVSKNLAEDLCLNLDNTRLPAPASPRKLADLAAEWEAAFARWKIALDEDQEGNLTTPDCLKWEARRIDLHQRISETEISDLQDLRALIRFIWTDGEVDQEDYPDVPRWALVKLMSWASTAA